MSDRSSVRLLPEKPVKLKDDALGFKAYAQTLADAARESTQPLTIGVFGEWGTGKSSLMQMVADTLSEYKNIVVVKCNAWQFQHEDQPLFPLVASVIRRFDDHRSGPGALESVLGYLKQAADAVDSQTPTDWSITEVSAAPADMPDRLDELLNQSQYAKAFQLLSEIEVPKGWKFVVFIDDLDRCSPKNAVRLLESIKLVLDQPGFVFVLGVSRIIIEEHIEYLYRKKLGVKKFDGSSYLEKLIQLPFPIPSHRDRINDLAGQLAGTIDEPGLVDHLEMLASVFEFNPRALIRVVNNLIIDRSINENLQESGTMDKVPLGMFAVSRALQHRWASTHRLLELATSDLAESIASWAESGVPDPEEPNSGLSDDEAETAIAMRKSPGLTSLLHSRAGIDWLTDESGRVAAAQFVRQHKRETTQHPVDEFRIFDAYISYPKRNLEEANALRDGLVAYDLEVFLDKESINVGEEFQVQMEASLSTARSLIFMFGKTTPASTFQRQELLAMLDRQNSESAPRIFPVVLPDADPKVLFEKFPEVSKLHMIHLTGEEQALERAIRDIMNALRYRAKKVSRKSSKKAYDRKTGY